MEEEESEANKPNARFTVFVADVEKTALRMTEALRRDFCGKVAALSCDARQKLHARLVDLPSHKTHRSVIDALGAGGVTYKHVAADAELAQFVDSGAAVVPMLEVTGGMRRSFLSLQTAWEHLVEWRDSFSDVASCSNEWQLLGCLGALGLPVEVKRPAAIGLSPFAIEVTRVCATPADTASFTMALQAKSSIVPPEGGVAVEDLLVLVDPDAPRASRLAISSMIIKESYTSLVYYRELPMYTGAANHLALHAHALFNVVQPPAPGIRREDLEAQMRRQYFGRAYQCAACRFGPIDHFACGDLAAHNGQRVGSAVINNSCPRCGWFSRVLSDWPKWDGTVPEEALLSCNQPDDKEAMQITAASAEIALRICYSARVIWAGQEAQQMCNKLADWETLTSEDGVEHPVQLLLALAVNDDLPADIFGPVPMAQLLNEVCARRADDELRRVGTVVGRRRVGAFLSVSYFSAPQVRRDISLERHSEAVMESCSADYAINPDGFDFKSWVRGALMPWAAAILFVRRLRAALQKREGGWCELARDMEAGPDRYADVIKEIQRPAGGRDSPAALLGVRCKQDAPRVLATVAAQAFLHSSPQSRRTKDVGGLLDEPLGTVSEEQTLRGLCKELRMSYYYDSLAAKKRYVEEAMRENYFSHVHSLNKQQFWRLWEACYGEDMRRFLASANHGFCSKYTPYYADA
jgi:hypothetical protein